MPRTRRVSPRNFFGGLSPEHFEIVRELMRPVELQAGELLFAQGEVGRAAYVLDEGQIELTVRLPGGAESRLGVVHAGEITGELALMTDARRSAGGRAIGRVRAFAIDRLDFRGMLAYFHPASFAVMRRLALLAGDRVREITLRLTAAAGAADLSDSAGDPLEAPPGREDEAAASFDVRPFLPFLACFEAFTREDLDELLATVGGRFWTLPRGRVVAHRGQAPRAAYVVVRGAIEELAGEDRALRRVGILGPGTIVGELPLLLGSARLGVSRVREDAVLLEIPAHAFEQLVTDPQRVSFKFLTALTQGLIERLTQTTRVLARVSAEPSLGPAEAARSEARVRAARVLVVDDSAMHRDILRLHLEELGHTVEEAEDGAAALDRLDRAPAFDAVLLDVRMPKLDGYETLARMKASEALRGVPVIMISAVDSIESAVRCLQLGAEDYLPRTFDASLLEARLGACMERERIIG